MAQVFKIKFEDTLRRISVPLSTVADGEHFGYDSLELKIRDLFQIPSTSRVILTYTDGEDDIVTMTDNQDLKDACLMQKLNPLKLEVKTVPKQTGVEAMGSESGLNTTEFNVEALLKGLFPESTAKAIDGVLARYPPCLFTTVPAHVLPEALDTFLATLAAGNFEITAQLQSADQVIAPGVAVHKYIECDNCFMCPIVGPRYKSLKKHDYDLCLSCFKKVGNATEYRKFDRPSISGFSNREVSSKVENDHCFLSSSSKLSSIRRPSGVVSLYPKPSFVVKESKDSNETLDAEFIMDVTIPDGSKVEVDTTFSKVWRLKNCGMLPWPQHTKLVHIGGTMLGATGVVTLKLPEDGLPCNSETDVIVDLKAPERAGQYVANWRLMAPSGQMFGHSVWVLIEGVPVCNKSQTCETEEPQTEKELKDLFSEKANASDSLRKDSDECDEGVMADLGLGEVGYNADCLLLNLKEQCGGETDGFSLVESVNNGHDDECEAIEEFEMVAPLPQEVMSGVFSCEQNEPCQDSLASTDWDHMLKELEELGFHDKRTNIKELLLKSEGSIKRAVKELMELEKQMSGKMKAA